MLKALGKGKWELDGIEILAFSEMMKWFSSLQKAIEMETARDEEEAKKAAAQAAAPVPSAKPVENPIKPMSQKKKGK